MANRLTSWRRGLRYARAVILVAVILAKLAGQDKPKGMAEWVRLRKELFVALFQLKRPTMPHAVTYERVLTQGFTPEELERLINECLSSLPTTGQTLQLALDSKTLRGVVASDPERRLQLLAAFLPGEGIVLFQVAIEPATNEITTAPTVLKCWIYRAKS